MLVTEPVLTIVPGVVGWTTIVTDDVPLAARVPRLKVKTLPTGVTPPVAETNVTPEGRVSVSVTPADGDGPLFTTVSV